MRGDPSDPSEVFADAIAGLEETLTDALRQSRLDNYVVMGNLPLQRVYVERKIKPRINK